MQQLARWHLHLRDLVTRNRDSRDFHEVSVETMVVRRPPFARPAMPRARAFDREDRRTTLTAVRGTDPIARAPPSSR